MNGSASKVLKAMQRKLGIRETNFHSLRSSFITDMLSAGVPASKVQKLVGHKDYEMMEVYTRLHAEELVGATDGIAVDINNIGVEAKLLSI